MTTSLWIRHPQLNVSCQKEIRIVRGETQRESSFSLFLSHLSLEDKDQPTTLMPPIILMPTTYYHHGPTFKDFRRGAIKAARTLASCHVVGTITRY